MMYFQVLQSLGQPQNIPYMDFIVTVTTSFSSKSL